MSNTFKTMAIAAVATVLGLGAGTASANSILFESVTVTPMGSTFEYNYSVETTNNSRIESGDFFAIIDFAGYVDGSIMAPTNFTAMTEAVTLPISGINGSVNGDDSDITNLVFTYNGPTTNGPVMFSDFIAETTFANNTTFGLLAARDTALNGAKVVNSSIATVPVVPTPTAALGGLALIGVAASGRFRRRALNLG